MDLSFIASGTDGQQVGDQSFFTGSETNFSFFTDLNVLVKGVIEQKKGEINACQAIVRCDELPQVAGGEKELTVLFDCLFSMILQHPPLKSKVFIYLKCQEHIGEAIPISARERYMLYELCFFTNIMADLAWHQLYAHQLNKCKMACREMRGVFMSEQIKNTGCVFTLRLPGKIKNESTWTV
jgi:hypothetical protein